MPSYKGQRLYTPPLREILKRIFLENLLQINSFQRADNKNIIGKGKQVKGKIELFSSWLPEGIIHTARYFPVPVAQYKYIT